MKKILLFLTALMTMLVFTGCDQGAGDSKSLESDWKIKGSFVADWPSFPFTMDEENNDILTYEMTTKYTIGYEFVLVGPDGKTEWKAPVATPVVSKDTPVVFTKDGTAEGGEENALWTNATFKAAKSTYTVKVDVTDPTKPSVTIIPGETDAVLTTFANLSEALLIKGSAFDFGWTATAGTADATAKTVTFKDIAIGEKKGEFGFQALHGFLQGTDVTSPTVIDTPTTSQGLILNDSNIKLIDPPKEDSTYTIVVTIDAEGDTVADIYKMTVTLTAVGTTDWAFDVPETVYLLGALSVTDWSDWSETDTGREALTLTNKIASYTFTSTADAAQKFKWANEAEAGWNGLVGYGGADITGTTIAITDDDGNFMFTAVTGTEYTMTMDYSATDYPTTGVPKLTITSK